MTPLKIIVQTRKVLGRKVKQLRVQGLIPANLFGKKIPSVSLQLSLKDFQKVYSTVGESTLIYLHIDGEKDDRPAMVTEVTKNPVTGLVLHVSFHQVDLKEKITAPVSIKLTGEAPAEKEKLGILVQQLDEIEIEALPATLPDHLEIDVSPLTAINQAIYVKDLKLDSKLEVKSDPESIIAKIEPLAKEEVKDVTPVTETPATTETETKAESAPVAAAEPKAESK